jgi:hypothetical protein
MAKPGLSRHKKRVTTLLAYLFGFLMLVVVGLVVFIALFPAPLYLLEVVMVALLGAALSASAWYAVSREPRKW